LANLAIAVIVRDVSIPYWKQRSGADSDKMDGRDILCMTSGTHVWCSFFQKEEADPYNLDISDFGL
jgi:hypothetical protein